MFKRVFAWLERRHQIHLAKKHFPGIRFNVGDDGCIYVNK